MAKVGQSANEAFDLAASRHRGPVFLDVSLEALFGTPPEPAPQRPQPAVQTRPAPGALDEDQLTQIAQLLASAERPVLVLGSDVWIDGAEHAARAAAEELGLPVIANGQGRGILPPSHHC